jgi:hypothetical protein
VCRALASNVGSVIKLTASNGGIGFSRPKAFTVLFGAPDRLRLARGGLNDRSRKLTVAKLWWPRREPHKTAADRSNPRFLPLQMSPRKLEKFSLETDSYHPAGAWSSEPPSRVFIGRFSRQTQPMQYPTEKPGIEGT